LAELLKQEFGSFYVKNKTFTPKKNDKKRGYVAGAEVTTLKLLCRSTPRPPITSPDDSPSCTDGSRSHSHRLASRR
jgi:hypothetical protein